MLCRRTSNRKLITTKRTNTSKLKKAEYVYLSQPETDHQGKKIFFTEFRWIVPCIFENVLSNNIYLVRKNGTNKTQALHCMRLRHLTPQKPLPDIRITPQEWKPDPEVSLKHDDLYARAWECQYERPTFDAENDSVMPPSSPEIVV